MDWFIWNDGVEEKAVEMFKELIRINTANPPGNEMEAVRYIKKLLDQKGIENHCIENSKGRGSIVAKIRGGDETPIILISHLDVVPAEEDKWEHPPFEAVEEDGIIWGRGTLDTKQLTAMELTAFMALRSHEHQLNRDVFFVASADEETGSKEGMEQVVKAYPELLRKSFVINEGGGFPLSFYDNNYILCAAGEKGICRIRLSTEGSGGHSSCPPENQAIVTMAEALDRLTAYSFNKKYTAVSRKFIIETGIIPEGEPLKDSTMNNLLQYMLYDGLIINSITAGERFNVIPKDCNAEIEFRLLPGTTREEIVELMKTIFKDIAVKWELICFEEGYESDINTDIIKQLEKNCEHFGFNGRMIPIIALGRTDGRYFGSRGTSIYGFSPVLMSDNFTEVLKRVHNHNERISRASYVFGTKVMTKTLLDICFE